MRQKKLMKRIAISFAALCALLSMAALAADNPDSEVTEGRKQTQKEEQAQQKDPATAEQVTVLPVITVTGSPIDETSYNVLDATTATKTDTPIMETPYSIKVVPQQVLQDQQAIRVDKALENVSGVIRFPANTASTDEFILRGFQNTEFYRDGFRFDATRASKRDTANLERVEVLKGPGSILFGRAEPGGVINLVTKQPLAAPYYSLQQQFGSFDFYRTTVDATGPITKDDTLLYRFNLAYEDTESFRDFVENDRVFVAPVIQWNISDRTQVKLELDYLHSKVFPDQGIPILGNRPAPLPRERNLSEPSAIEEQDDTLVGLTWSHAFNDQWTVRHRFNAQFIDNGDTLNFFCRPGAGQWFCRTRISGLHEGHRHLLQRPGLDRQVRDLGPQAQFIGGWRLLS